MAIATPGFAQQGWTGVETPVADFVLGEVGTDGVGNVRVIWSEPLGDGVHTVVRTARRSAETGAWSEPAEAYRASVAPGVVCGQLVVDTAGNATASCAVISDTLVSAIALRYTAATDTWTPEVLETAIGVTRPHLAMDAAGNTYAVWASNTLRLRRHMAGTDTWSPIVALPVVAISPKIAADARGNLFVVWLTYDEALRITINAAHYDTALGRWRVAAGLRPPSHGLGDVQLAVDETGHAMVAWTEAAASGVPSVVRAARYAASTASFESVFDLSHPGAEFTAAQLVMDAEGNAFVAWHAKYSGYSQIQSRWYVASTDAWGAVTPSVMAGLIPGGPKVVTDLAGNVTLAWYVGAATETVLQAVRYKKPTAMPTVSRNVITISGFISRAWVVCDRRGSVTLLWHQQVGTDRGVQATRWEATPPAPTITSTAVSSGVLRVSVAPPETIEPDFGPTNYEYSTDDGATWIARAPTSTTSPIEITGLPGGTTQLRLRAVNHAGGGAASAPFAVTLSAAPDAPVNFATTAVVGARVTLRWGAPTGATMPEAYVVEGGQRPGEVLAMLPTGSTVPTFTFTAPAGVFYLRLRAYAGASWSAPSNEIRIVVDVPMPPSAPAAFLGLVNGSTLALSWTNTATGGAPERLWLNASGAWSGALPLPLIETYSLAGVPPGTYTLSVSAANMAGMSPLSNAVTLTVPGACNSAPEVPRAFVVVASGRTIHLHWDAPASGSAVAGYTVVVTGSFARSVQTMERSLTGRVLPGSYTLSVVAINACGTSGPTPERTVTIT